MARSCRTWTCQSPAGDRHVMEFKYLSNKTTREQGIETDRFEASPKDLAQLTAYLHERIRQAP